MLTANEFKDLKEKRKKCPYGRKTNVGENVCINCKFYHIMKETCSGDKDSVKKHIEFLKLDY